MNCWTVRAEPAPCRGSVGLAWACHLAAALAPWVAGCTPAVAMTLSATCLLALRITVAALPGRHCPLRAICCQDGEWTVVMSDGRRVAARVERSTRVFARLVACRLVAGGRRFDWWLPAYALSAGDFRRLKVAVRCISPGPDLPNC
jgi:hypothetical protein